MLARHSLNVGMGREFGKTSGARGGGSRNIWCETELCLYLWPRRCPMLDFVTGDLDMDVLWKLKGPAGASRGLSLDMSGVKYEAVVGERMGERELGS